MQGSSPALVPPGESSSEPTGPHSLHIVPKCSQPKAVLPAGITGKPEFDCVKRRFLARRMTKKDERILLTLLITNVIYT
jgi:hypothetical protein